MGEAVRARLGALANLEVSKSWKYPTINPSGLKVWGTWLTGSYRVYGDDMAYRVYGLIGFRF